MKESLARIKDWIQRHPWIAAGILGVVILAGYLYFRSKGSGSGSSLSPSQPTTDSTGMGTGASSGGDLLGSGAAPGATGSGSGLGTGGLGTLPPLPDLTGGGGLGSGIGNFTLPPLDLGSFGSIPGLGLSGGSLGGSPMASGLGSSGFAAPAAVPDLGSPAPGSGILGTNLQYAPRLDLASIAAATGGGSFLNPRSQAPSVIAGGGIVGTNLQYAPRLDLASIAAATGGGRPETPNYAAGLPSGGKVNPAPRPMLPSFSQTNLAYAPSLNQSSIASLTGGGRAPRSAPPAAPVQTAAAPVTGPNRVRGRGRARAVTSPVYVPPSPVGSLSNGSMAPISNYNPLLFYTNQIAQTSGGQLTFRY